MQTLTDQPEGFAALERRSRELLARVLADVDSSASGIRVRGRGDVLEGLEPGRVYRLVEGGLTHLEGDRAVFFYDEGDLIGLERAGQEALADGNVRVRGDFAVVVDEYRLAAILAAAAAVPEVLESWTGYLASRARLFGMLYAATVREGAHFVGEPRQYQEGEEMIRQGDEGTEVFTLLDGAADVFVDGIKVGEILPEATFGALAALTGLPRNASVVAREASMVLVWPRERFHELMESRPGAITKLVEDMAQTIDALNERVIELSAEH